MKKVVALVLCVLLAAALLAPCVGATTGGGTDTSVPAATPTSADPVTTPRFVLEGGTVTLTQGDWWKGGVISAKNSSTENLTGVTIEMVPNKDLAVYPFAIDLQSYISGVTDNVGTGASASYALPDLRVRGDALAGYYDIPVIVRYTAGGTACEETLTYRVLIRQAGGGSAATDDYVPKVIVTGFSTNPTEVIAGEDFTLTITFKNTSSTGAVQNLKAALSSEGGTFNPVSGSSTLFISNLAPGASSSVSIKLHAKADAAPGSYNVNFALSYDAPNTKDNAGVSDTEVVAIPVKQVPKAQVTKMQLQPSEVYVGNDLNVMSTVNNTGKSKLYNVNVKVSDTGSLFVVAEQYLGNLDSGATGNVDLYLTPQMTGSTTINLDVTYEDENGNTYSASQTADVTVMEKAVMEPGFDDPSMMPVEDVSGGVGWWIWVVIALVAGGVTALILIKRRKQQIARERDRQTARELEEQYLNQSDDNGNS